MQYKEHTQVIPTEGERKGKRRGEKKGGKKTVSSR